MKIPDFLTLADVIEIHKDQISLYGGEYGTRDMRLLESALAQPEASFGGEWLHADLFEMASAYAFHICMNHPFLDGNKRSALVTALTFLEINGVSVLDPKEKLREAMIRMAEGHLTKKEFAIILKELPKDSS